MKFLNGLGNVLRWIYKKTKLTGSIMMISFSFLFAAYIDLLIGALINTENDYLYDSPSNWGINGDLNYSDQMTVLLGTTFNFILTLFPLFVLYLVITHKNLSMQHGMHLARFEKRWGMLIADDRTDVPVYLHYALAFIIKRTVFVYVCFYLYEPKFILIQIIVVIYLSLIFSCYLIEVRPHKNKFTNNVEVYNEFFFLILALATLLLTDLVVLTDLVEEAKLKKNVGWWMIGISFFNLMCPNLLIMIKHTAIGIKDICLMLYDEITNYSKNAHDRKVTKARKALEKSRLFLINNQGLSLKPEFFKPPNLSEHITPDMKVQQVVAIMQIYNEPDIFRTREGKRRL